MPSRVRWKSPPEALTPSEHDIETNSASRLFPVSRHVRRGRSHVEDGHFLVGVTSRLHSPTFKKAKEKRMLVLWPYSWSDRRDSDIGFAQQHGFFECVQICVFGDGVQGKGRPFPCSSNTEAPERSDFCFFPGTENSASAVRANADEVFCWLPTMGAVGGVPRLRVLWPNTRCLKSESRAAGRALLPKRILR
jgi:hypothetical protein